MDIHDYVLGVNINKARNTCSISKMPNKQNLYTVKDLNDYFNVKLTLDELNVSLAEYVAVSKKYGIMLDNERVNLLKTDDNPYLSHFINWANFCTIYMSFLVKYNFDPLKLYMDHSFLKLLHVELSSIKYTTPAVSFFNDGLFKLNGLKRIITTRPYETPKRIKPDTGICHGTRVKKMRMTHI